MGIITIIIVLAFAVVVMQSYFNSQKVDKAYEQGKKEVLDCLVQNYSYDMEQLVPVLEFDKQIATREIYVSGPYDIDSVKKAAKNYKMYYKVLMKTIKRVFEKYSYEADNRLITGKYGDEIMEYCNKLLGNE